MHIIVCVKQVLETRVPIRVEDGRIIQKEPALVYVANPKDVAALEEAMYLKEMFGSEVTVVSLGAQRAESVLHYCLARGVDRALHILSPSTESLDTFTKVALLGKVIAGLDYDLVLCGNRSQDEGTGHVVPFLADFLGCPHMTKVVRIEAVPEQRLAVVWRQVEMGWREEVECDLPGVFGVERTVHEPRYVSNFAYEAALSKAVECLEVEQVGTGEQPRKWLQVVNISPPRPRTKKVFVPDSSLSPEERFQLLMSGGAGPKQESDFVEGAPEQVTKKLVEFLKNEGFVSAQQENSSIT